MNDCDAASAYNEDLNCMELDVPRPLHKWSFNWNKPAIESCERN